MQNAKAIILATFQEHGPLRWTEGLRATGLAQTTYREAMNRLIGRKEMVHRKDGLYAIRQEWVEEIIWPPLIFLLMGMLFLTSVMSPENAWIITGVVLFPAGVFAILLWPSSFTWGVSKITIA